MFIQNEQVNSTCLAGLNSYIIGGVWVQSIKQQDPVRPSRAGQGSLRPGIQQDTVVQGEASVIHT